MALGDARIRAAKPRATILKLSDGNGLQLWITPARGKHWKLAYRYGQLCAGGGRLREIECDSHLFLYRLEFRCRSSSWARQVDGDFLEDAAHYLGCNHEHPTKRQAGAQASDIARQGSGREDTPHHINAPQAVYLPDLHQLAVGGRIPDTRFR